MTPTQWYIEYKAETQSAKIRPQYLIDITSLTMQGSHESTHDAASTTIVDLMMEESRRIQGEEKIIEER